MVPFTIFYKCVTSQRDSIYCYINFILVVEVFWIFNCKPFFFFYKMNVMLKCNIFDLHVKTNFWIPPQTNKLKRQKIMEKQNIDWDDNDIDIFNWTKTIFLFIFWKKNEKVQIIVVCVRFQMFYVVLRINCAW